MIGRAVERYASGRWLTVALATLGLATAVAVSAAAASLDAIVPLFMLLLALGALAIAIADPLMLFYGYCAAIPFNFALPPGPAGTVARIAGMIFFVGYLVRRPDSLRLSAIPGVGWLFLVWTLLTALWAVDTASAWSAWISLAQLMAITLLVGSLVAANPGIVRGALWSYAIAATLTSVVATIVYWGNPALFLAGRAVAFPNEDPGLFSSILLPAVLFLMGEIQSPRGRPAVRIGALVALFGCVIGLAFSGSRSAWVALLVSIAVWLIIKRDRRQILPVAALGLGVSLLLATVPGAAEFLSGRLETSITTGGAGRTDIWAVGLSIIASAPILGVGFGNFPLAFDPHAIAQAAAGSSPIYLLSAGRAPHNVLLGAFAETGIIGGGLLVLFVASALWRASEDRSADTIRVTLVGLFVQSMFLDVLFQKQLWLFLAMAFGLGIALHAGRSAASRPGGPAGGSDARPHGVRVASADGGAGSGAAWS